MKSAVLRYTVVSTVVCSLSLVLVWPEAFCADPSSHNGASGLVADIRAPDWSYASAREELLTYFRNANKDYLNDRFEEAVQGYLKVLEGGIRHPDLFFCLANAYYLSGRKGLAVLFFEKALDIDSSYEKAASNLAIVQKELVDRVEMPEGEAVGDPRWQQFLRGVSIGWLTWMFFCFYLLAFAVMIARRLPIKESLGRFMFWLNVPILFLALVFGGLLASRIYIKEGVRHGVVIVGIASLLEGPERFAKEKMQVHEGLKARLIKQVGDYMRVRLANGVEGFIKDAHLGRI